MKKDHKVLLVGGGSGGHIKPLLPIANKLLEEKNIKLIFYCDKENLALAKTIFKTVDVEIKPIVSGKFRRYHHFKWWQHLAPSILLPNVRDLFKVVFAYFQAVFILLKNKPDVIFAKGGYPCLPFGLASKLTATKLVIHDSDAVAGLTNRVLSKYANKIITGMPVENYDYPKTKTVFAGIPIDQQLKTIDNKKQQQLKKKLALSSDKKLIILTGGGLGSTPINNLAVKIANHYPKYQFVLFSGKRDYARIEEQNKTDNLQIFDFKANFVDYLMASDMVIARGGATTIAEIATAEKLAIILPSYKLTGGHQLKNAQILKQAKAAEVFDERKIEDDRGYQEFFQLFEATWNNKTQLVKNIKQFSHLNASEQISQIIIEQLD